MKFFNKKNDSDVIISEMVASPHVKRDASISDKTEWIIGDNNMQSLPTFTSEDLDHLHEVFPQSYRRIDNINLIVYYDYKWMRFVSLWSEIFYLSYWNITRLKRWYSKLIEGVDFSEIRLDYGFLSSDCKLISLSDGEIYEYEEKLYESNFKPETKDGRFIFGSMQIGELWTQDKPFNVQEYPYKCKNRSIEEWKLFQFDESHGMKITQIESPQWPEWILKVSWYLVTRRFSGWFPTGFIYEMDGDNNKFERVVYFKA